MVGNGSHIHCEGFCQTGTLTLQNSPFTIPFFVLPIEGVDIVLGMTWLGSLGPILADFSIPCLCNNHTLRGTPLHPSFFKHYPAPHAQKRYRLHAYTHLSI